MPYQIDGSIKARGLGHQPEFIGTLKTRSFDVDKYLCRCGDCEIQIASKAFPGVWVSSGALKPCTKAEPRSN